MRIFPWLFVLLMVVIGVVRDVPRYATPSFDPATLKGIAQEASESGEGSRDRVQLAITKMKAKYPNLIDDNPRWLFNNAGGAMGSMAVLHASASEYVIIFGTSTGSDGHTGRFLVDDYFNILAGEQWAELPGAMEREVYKPGDVHFLPAGTAKHYRCPGECWALEYARGSIPSMMPFGVVEIFFKTLDWPTLAETLRVSASSMFNHMRNGKV